MTPSPYNKEKSEGGLMRKIISACLAGFIVGILQSLYFSAPSVSFIEVIASPLILFSTVVGLGSGLAATETDNVGVTALVGIIAGCAVYAFFGYYSGLYFFAAVLGIMSGIITALVAHVV
jgi:hypothetical protein